MSNRKDLNRRDFLKLSAIAALATAGISACKRDDTAENSAQAGEMTYRVCPSSGDKVSILGYGCMRWPTIDGSDEFDQDEINRMVDYAIEHGVNYFDTSPAYCRGLSEKITGIALSRHPRDSYFIATKLSNFDNRTWPRDKSIQMFEDSLDYLQTDYIDYLLLHAIGGTARDTAGNELDSTQTFYARYMDNGILDWLAEQRQLGRIRNLGFSYHGDVKIFDMLLSWHDKYKWDFVQIQHNYIDFTHSYEANSQYMLEELSKRGIPAVIMEPLRGGRLANLPHYITEQLLAARPDDSIASWAFRYAATDPNVLTVLSGMTYMEHVQDNVRTYSPLEPCSQAELDLLAEAADEFVNSDYIPCTACNYCMPCPYGIDIPGIFSHYNKCITEKHIIESPEEDGYAKARKAFLVGYDRSVPKLRQADHCIACGTCLHECPQRIKIPEKMQMIDAFVEKLKRS